MKKKKRSITLLEIMIVIFLIGLIGGVVGYNMKGSIDRGRAFKTEESMARISDILELEMISQGLSPPQVVVQAQSILAKSGFFKDPKTALNDGWGQPMTPSWEETEHKFKLTSLPYEEYKTAHQTVPQG